MEGIDEVQPYRGELQFDLLSTARPIPELMGKHRLFWRDIKSQIVQHLREANVSDSATVTAAFRSLSATKALFGEAICTEPANQISH